MFQDAMDQFETENYIDELVKEKNRYKQALQDAKEVAENAEESDEMTIVWDIANEALEITHD